MNNKTHLLFLILICLFGFNSKFIYTQTVCEEIEKNCDIDIEPKSKKGKSLLEVECGENKFRFSMKNRAEGFYGRSIQLFSDSDLDQVLYWQGVWDLRASTSLGNYLKSELVLRNKARWGNINAINHVTENEVKLKDAVTGKHKHSLGKLLFWMREGWIEILLNDALNIKACNNHYLKLGAFPFKLGRGISLGEAYAVSPGLLGFYSNNVIDQYAFGWLLHGDIVKDQLSYDLYSAILENLSDSFDNVNEKVFAQQIGRRDNPERGFGHINFLVAARLNWNVEICKDSFLNIEPYILYNRVPEQKIDFPANAKSNLATLGLCVDYEGGNWEYGFEFAKNFGSQKVRGWDRNKVLLDRDTSNGNAIFDYSHVLSQDPLTSTSPKKAVESNANKKIVDESKQNPALNGKQIDSTGLYNSITRFRAPYTNKFVGFMFVTDLAYWFNDNLRLAGTLGWATGDEDPNQDVDDPNDSDMDGTYEGFVGLQEIYSGKRVTSVFVIGSNRIPRPLVFPSPTVAVEDRFASNTSGFANLVYVGTGLEWTTYGLCCKKEFVFRPNLLAYWQDTATKKFSIAKKLTINELASKFLGVEMNVFVDMKIVPSLKGFFVGGIFFPGQHYKDVRGKPLNAEQREILDDLDTTGFVDNSLPLLGTAFLGLVLVSGS